MKKSIFVLFALVALGSCENKISSLSELKSNFYEFKEKAIHSGEVLSITFGSNADKIDSVSLTLNGKSFKNNTRLDSANSTLGLNKLQMKVYMDGDFIWGETVVSVLSSFKETPVEFEVVKEYPHPAELFTEGFFFFNNRIYESAGQKGKSKLVSYLPGSINYIQEKKQDAEDFSEGIALLNNKIYQLTYRQRKIYVYDHNTLELTEMLRLPEMVKEGWGMTSNGQELIVSDGTQNIFFFDERFNLQRKIQVAGYVSIYTNLNELEFINGKIYANIWQTNYILVINPESGAVEQYYDVTSLSETRGNDDVLNGIALKGNNLLITGKNWNNIYELISK